jgi:hypothetical protein
MNTYRKNSGKIAPAITLQANGRICGDFAALLPSSKTCSMIAIGIAVIIFAKYCEAALKQIKKERKKIALLA